MASVSQEFDTNLRMVTSEWGKGRSNEEEGVGHAGRVPGRLEDRDECTERASEATPARAATERARRKPNNEAVYRASLVRRPRRAACRPSLPPAPVTSPRVTPLDSPFLALHSNLSPSSHAPQVQCGKGTDKPNVNVNSRTRTRARVPSFSFRQSVALLMPKFIFGRRRTADNFLGDIIIVVVVLVVVVVEVL